MRQFGARLSYTTLATKVTLATTEMTPLPFGGSRPAVFKKPSSDGPSDVRTCVLAL